MVIFGVDAERRDRHSHAERGNEGRAARLNESRRKITIDQSPLTAGRCRPNRRLRPLASQNQERFVAVGRPWAISHNEPMLFENSVVSRKFTHPA
jgi:hypothetical protein